MAKRTAIIDIGSNSITMVVYEKSSRFAFHLVEKIRSRVRIGEGAYTKGGVLQETPMQRAYDSIEDFLYIAKNLKCKKVLCLATSALRDAPNKQLFLNRVKKDLKLGIKVIDGDKEAYFGALSASNLLSPLDEATTIDIGGGSTELAKIVNGKIVDTISIDLGTVRLKELFFDKKKNTGEVESYIEPLLKQIPRRFDSDAIIGIGGTIRALSSSIIKKNSYPLQNSHAFEYDIDNEKDYIKKIINSQTLKLKKFDIKNSRIDTIREGSLIFYKLLKYLNAKSVVTSKAGVREGAYLADILRNSNYKFPVNFNVSVKSLLDRFSTNDKNSVYQQKIALQIFDVTLNICKHNYNYRKVLGYAAKLFPITKAINIYSNNDYNFYFLLENLNFCLTHKEKVLIALLVKLSSQKSIKNEDIEPYKDLLPSFEEIKCLTFILSLTQCVTVNYKIQKVEFEFLNNTLYIKSKEKMFLTKECIKKLSKPSSIAIKVINTEED